MLIEHDGKRIDTEREIRWKSTQSRARFIGKAQHTAKDSCVWVEFIPSGNLDYWCDWFGSVKDFVREFENVPQKHERWINVYQDDTCGCAHKTKELADANAKSVGLEHRRIACCRIEWQS